MLKNDKSDYYKHYDSEKTQWTCFAALALILSIVSLTIFLVMRPQMIASKLMIILFVTQFIAAGIVRFTFFARRKHQNQIAIILVTITSLIIAAFIMVFFNFSILPIFKDLADF